MKSSDFNKVKANIYNYFNDPEKWEEKEHGEFSADTKEFWFERLEHEKVKEERLRKIERESEGE